MRIDVLTLFPEMFESPLTGSILGRARDSGLVEIVLTNIRDFATDNYHKVDDKPYGGGPGMVMMPGPVFSCFDHVQAQSPDKGAGDPPDPPGTAIRPSQGPRPERRETPDPDCRPV